MRSANWSFSGYLANAFAFSRGSTDYHLYVDNPPTDLFMYAAEFPRLDPPSANRTDFLNASMSQTPKAIVVGKAAHWRFFNHQPAASLYSNLLNSVNSALQFLTAPGTYPFTTSAYYRAYVNNRVIVVANVTASAIVLKLFRSAGDDAQLGAFIGCPPLYQGSNTNLTGAYDPGNVSLGFQN